MRSAGSRGPRGRASQTDGSPVTPSPTHDAEKAAMFRITSYAHPYILVQFSSSPPSLAQPVRLLTPVRSFLKEDPAVTVLKANLF